MSHSQADSQAEKNIKDDVEKYGWSVALFEKDTATLSFAYTIGLWKTFKHPEIIAFGLPINTLHTILNDAGELVREGNLPLLNVNNYAILNKLPVQFRSVEPSNISDYFGYAQWFHEYNPFPAIQLFWPDKAGVFSWEMDFDTQYEFDQPVLDKVLDFKFFGPRNVATFVAKQIFREGRPILRVYRDEEGEWQFLTGDNVTEDDIMVVTLEEVVKRDPTINSLFNLPTGRVATREYIGAKWLREVAETEEE